jgi:hypothetical protein
VQNDDPPHSLHLLSCRPWLQIDDPPHSLHLYFSLPWLQINDPPHSLHLLFSWPWLQIDDPLHSLHLLFCRPWMQIHDPPHSLHLLFCLPWLQMCDPPHSLHLLFCLPWMQIDGPSISVCIRGLILFLLWFVASADLAISSSVPSTFILRFCKAVLKFSVLPILFEVGLPCVLPSISPCTLVFILFLFAARADLAVSSLVWSLSILRFRDAILYTPSTSLWKVSAMGIAETLISDFSEGFEVQRAS